MAVEYLLFLFARCFIRPILKVKFDRHLTFGCLCMVDHFSAFSDFLLLSYKQLFTSALPLQRYTRPLFPSTLSMFDFSWDMLASTKAMLLLTFTMF